MKLSYIYNLIEYNNSSRINLIILIKKKFYLYKQTITKFKGNSFKLNKQIKYFNF